MTLSQKDHQKQEEIQSEGNQPEAEQSPAPVSPESSQPEEQVQAPDTPAAQEEPAEGEDKPRKLTSKEVETEAARVAKILGETERTPRRQIAKLVKLIGVEYVDDLVKRTLEIEENGGMMTANGERRRTVGGVFFQLARETLSEENRDRIFNTWRHAMNKRRSKESKYPVFEFDQRAEILNNILGEPAGEVSEMRVILTGHPGEIERRQDLVITRMQYTLPDGFMFPRGVPYFPEKESTYVVYIASKHWEQVERTLKKDDTDELVVDGLAAYDHELGQMVLYSTYATTKKTQKKERRAQKQKDEAAAAKQKSKAGKDGGDKAKAKKQKSADKNPAPAEQEAVPMPEINLPEGVPPEVAKKLGDLMRAAETYRRKVATLEAKPPNQQHGLEMTRRLLTGIEGKIDALKKEHSIEV